MTPDNREESRAFARIHAQRIDRLFARCEDEEDRMDASNTRQQHPGVKRLVALRNLASYRNRQEKARFCVLLAVLLAIWGTLGAAWWWMRP